VGKQKGILEGVREEGFSLGSQEKKNINRLGVEKGGGSE